MGRTQVVPEHLGQDGEGLMVGLYCRSPIANSRPPNTRDKLRGAHDRTMVLGAGTTVAAAAYHAPLRLHPPLVSFIALFGGGVGSSPS